MQKNRSAIDYFEVGIVKKKIEETKENREKTKHRKRNGRDWDKRSGLNLPQNGWNKHFL